MRTLELIRRLARHTASRDMDTLPVETRQDLLDAANDALAEVWPTLPPADRHAPRVVELDAPASLTVTTTAGSATTSSLLPTNRLGCAVLLAGDGVPNRIAGRRTLERPHAGTAGEISGLLWHDCVALEPEVVRLAPDVTLENPTSGEKTILTPWAGHFPARTELTVTPNPPCHYQVTEAGAVEVDDAPGAFLHLFPRPSAAWRLRFTVELSGRKLTLTDYAGNAFIGIPARAESLLAALAAECLLTLPCCTADEAIRTEIRTAAARERSLAPLKTHTSRSGQPATFGRRRGW